MRVDGRGEGQREEAWCETWCGELGLYLGLHDVPEKAGGSRKGSRLSQLIEVLHIHHTSPTRFLQRDFRIQFSPYQGFKFWLVTLGGGGRDLNQKPGKEKGVITRRETDIAQPWRCTATS